MPGSSKQPSNSEQRLLFHLCTLAFGLTVKYKESIHEMKTQTCSLRIYPTPLSNPHTYYIYTHVHSVCACVPVSVESTQGLTLSKHSTNNYTLIPNV